MQVVADLVVFIWKQMVNQDFKSVGEVTSI